MGDVERAMVGRRHTPRAGTHPGTGIPVEIDDETTPPPQAPPQPEEFYALSTDEQVRTLHSFAQAQAQATAQVWDARHVSDHVRALERHVNANTNQVTRLIVEVEHWSMATKQCIGEVDQALGKIVSLEAKLAVFFESQWPQLEKSITGFATALRDLDTRIGKLETSIEQIAGKQLTHGERLHEHDRRLSALELVRIEAGAASRERRKWFSWGKAAIAGVALVFGFLVAHARDLVSVFTK
jgi:chromosome segregation ATPase